MTWVMNEVLRLYSPAPNAQRQARKEMQVGELVIPKGTNIWFDIVGLNHDPCLWGEDVNEFRPERFKDGPSSACKHRLGFVPFGLGARTCVGQNLFKMEYKIVLSMILSSFSWSLSHNYSHSPAIVLTLRPSSGVPLVLRPLSRPGRSAP
uniref:Cytochrome P450 n=5 Tax=Nymphaea colorata TaxID=210225 RepID=A0A5K0VRB4_9MAGN